MSRRAPNGIVAAVGAVAISIALAAPASAATEVGNNCVANGAIPDYTMVQIGRDASSSLPLGAPAAGVATRWTVYTEPFEGAIPEQMKVFRPAGGPKVFAVVGESAVQTVVAGVNSFETRIPVQAGDRFGAYALGSFGTLYCQTSKLENVVGLLKENVGVGQTKEFETPALGFEVAISATVEPDADSDGYGDETQDKCPRSAAIQAECPMIELGTQGFARKGSALVLVAASSQTQVTVSGTVTTGAKGAAKGKRARPSATIKMQGGKKQLGPGKLVPYTLKFPSSLRSRLRGMSPSQSLTLNATAAATDVTGATSRSTVKLKLKGQG